MKNIFCFGNIGRGLFAGMATAVLILCLISCKGKNGGSSVLASGGQLSIYNWTFYIPDSLIEKFAKEYNIKVIYDVFDSNETMYAKIKAGGSNYDIVFPSGDFVSIMIHEGMFEKIDKTKLENLNNIDPAVLAQTPYDPDMTYSVPYYWGAACLIVNTAKVPNYEKSWSIFSRTDLRDRMTMLDDKREVLGDALVTLGYSVNSVNKSEIQAAEKLILNQWVPNITKFDSEAFGRGYANGDFWVVQGYPEAVWQEILSNPVLVKDTEFFFPKEGGPGYIDSMCILKNSKNYDNAHKFIDFIHRPEVYAEFCNTFKFPATVNVPARELITGTTLYDVEGLSKTENKIDLGESIGLYDTAWFDSIRIAK
ncbi:MAG: extracellular solute-binding protein [Termitinemataceae bacterium]|nr:MAG: extracellular solute-binding protein [Termitinemataceae bacterium]